MKLKFVAVAAMAAIASVGSYAATIAPLSPSATFANTVTGGFTDEWTFNLGTESVVAASLTNIEVSFGATSTGGILGLAAWLDGVQLFGPTSTVPGSYKLQVLAGATQLPAGVYKLTVSGTGITGANASYGGNIVATPVPEPETLAMMLAGLGALGFLARRRQNA
jgi:PEP-CTERM motif